tara:strand:+ start:4188 stop:10385 length:6198 start_codon:yes stop_codon:yes gene_type:complete
MNGGDGMREGASEVWARARFDFIKSDYEQDDAAAFLYAALDADRRGVPVLRSDAVFIECAAKLLFKADRFLPPQRKTADDFDGESINPNYTRGTPPIYSNSVLRAINGDKKTHYTNADEMGKRLYLANLMSGRIEYGAPDHTESGARDYLHHDSHPAQALDIFRYESTSQPFSPFTFLMNALYQDGHAKIYSDGEKAHEEATIKSKHPHHSPANLGKYTGNITLHSLYERGLNRWTDWYRNTFSKDPEDPENQFFQYKVKEWDGFDATKCYNPDGTIMNNEDLNALVESDPSVLPRHPVTKKILNRMGRNAYTYGTEMLTPGERQAVAQWIAEDKPDDASHIFDDNKMGKHTDWIPYLKRQALMRLSKEAQAARASGLGPAVMNQSAEHTGAQADSGSVGNASAKTIEQALQKVFMDKKTGEFHHYGSSEGEDEVSAYEWIRQKAFEHGMMAGHDEIDDVYRERWGLPNMKKDGSLHYNIDKKRNYQIADKGEFGRLSTAHLQKFAEQGLIPNDIISQLCLSTDENGGTPYIARTDNSGKAGEMIRDGLGPFVHNHVDNESSFSSIFAMPYAGKSGLGLSPNALVHIDDEMQPGLFTDTLEGEFMPQFIEGPDHHKPPEERFADQTELFEAFKGDSGNLGGLNREIRRPHRGTRNVMAADIIDNTEEQAHHRLHQKNWKSANRISLNGDVSRFPGGKDPVEAAGLTSTEHRGKWPLNYSLVFALAGGARHLDDNTAEGPNWIVPTDNLAKNLGDPEWWESRGAIPYVDRDESGRLDSAQLGDMMGDMGVISEMVDPERTDEKMSARGTSGADFYGGFNVYDTVRPNHLRDEHGDWNHYNNVVGDSSIDPTKDVPTFDPRHFITTMPEDVECEDCQDPEKVCGVHGYELANLNRDDAARHLLENAMDTGPSVTPAQPTMVPPTQPTTMVPPTAQPTMVPPRRTELMPTEDDPTEMGDYVRQASRRGIWTDDANESQIRPWGIDDGDISDYAFTRKDGNAGVLSYHNPHDIAENYLHGLQKQYDAHLAKPEQWKELAGNPDLKNLKDAIKHQQEICNELKPIYYPMEAMSADDAKAHGAEKKRQTRPVNMLNDTMHAVAQVGPKLRELVEKQIPGIFDPEIDVGTGEEDWNRANAAALAICEASERYVGGHMTDESNKKLGIGDVMSYHPRPVGHSPDSEPANADLHNMVGDRVREGSDSMLKLLHQIVTKGIANRPIIGERSEDMNNVYHMFKHAAARMNAVRDEPEMAAHEHVTAPDASGYARRTAGNRAWQTHVSQKADEISDEDLKRIIHDDPEGFLDSLEARHKFNTSGNAASIGIRSNGEVHRGVSAKDENESLKGLINMTKRQILGQTNWESPAKRGSARKSYVEREGGLVEREGGGVRAGHHKAARGGAWHRLNKNLLSLSQPIREKDVNTSVMGEDTVKLGRDLDGGHTIQRYFTSPPIQRMGQHMVNAPFSISFDHKGHPHITADATPMPLLNTHQSLLRHVSGQPKLQAMRDDTPAHMQSMSDSIVSGLRGPSDAGEWARPYFKKTEGYRQRRFKDYMEKGEPMEWLTFLKADEREKGDASPIKAAHRIFDLSDIQDLRGFSGSWVVSAWPEGQRVRIVRKDDDIETTGASLPSALKDEVKTINEKDFIIDAIYDGKHLHIVDLLKISSEDVTDEQMKDRIRALRSTFESTERIKTPQPINTRQTDDKGLKDAVDEIEGERIMLRDADSTYMYGEARHPKWVLLDNEKRVSVIILGQRGTTRSIYRLGIGPISEEEASALGNRAQKLGDKHYMDVGTADGDGSFDEGDHATVTVGSVTRRERDGHAVFTVNGAKLQSRAESDATDSAQTLGLLAKSGVPQIPHTVSVQGTNIVVSLPSLEDDVIYKAHRMENETGVLMDTWRIGRGESMKGDFSIRLAETVRPCWEPLAALMLKGVAKLDYDPRGERDKKKKEVLIDPRPEKKKPKRIDRNQILKDPVVIKALNLLDALLTKEKMTWTGPKGLAIGLGSEDSAPRGPTELTRPSTLPDFYPTEDDPEKPAKEKRKGGKTTTVTTDEGEKGALRISEDGAMLDLQSD